MRSLLWLRPPRWAALLLAALALALPGTPIWAQQDCPPGIHEVIDQPADGATNLSGTIRVDFHRNPPPQGWSWFGNPYVTVRDTTEFHNLVASGFATRITDTQFTFKFDTALLDPIQHEIFTSDDLGKDDNPFLTCFPGAPKVTFTVGPGPTTSRYAPAEKLRCRARDSVSTGSSTSPLTGQQSWTVPITSWNYKGATFPFGLTYASDSLKDPWALSTPEFAGLSEKNSKWSHPYAAWVDLYHDETGAEYAIWHRGGSSLTFQKSGSAFTAPDSGYSLTYDSGPITSPSYFCHSFYQTSEVPYGRFIVTAPDGTQFQFASVAWRTGYCTALPHYLLTHIQDRWGRALDVTWTHYTIQWPGRAAGHPRSGRERHWHHTGLSRWERSAPHRGRFAGAHALPGIQPDSG